MKFNPCPSVEEALALLQEAHDKKERKSHKFLGEILIEMGVISKEIRDMALEIQLNGDSSKIGEILVQESEGYCTEEHINEALLRQENMPVLETEQTKEAQRQYERIANWLYTLSWIRPHLKAFMIDIKFGDERAFIEFLPKEKRCSSEVQGGELSADIVDTLAKNPREFTALTGGSLFKEIEDYLFSHGFSATDRGGGGCGGHLGYPCTEEERDKLLGLLHSKFGLAIRIGTISTTVAWFAVRVPKKRGSVLYEKGDKNE